MKGVRILRTAVVVLAVVAVVPAAAKASIMLTVARNSDSEARLSVTGDVDALTGSFSPNTPSARAARVHLINPFSTVSGATTSATDNTFLTSQGYILTAYSGGWTGVQTWPQFFTAGGVLVDTLMLCFNANHTAGATITGGAMITLPAGSTWAAVGTSGNIWYGSDSSARLYTLTGTWNMVAGAVAELEANPAGGTLLDFGDVPQGTIGTLFSAVTLKNIGDPGTTIQLSGAQLPDPRFSIASGNLNATLGQNVSETFTLQYDAFGLGPGLITGTATFLNNSPEGNVTYNVRVNVVPIREPAGLGLIGLVLLGLRKRRS